MRRIACVAALLLISAGAEAAPLRADHACIGRWQGKGRNTGHRDSWTIDLTITTAPTGGRCGTIEYTNPKCGGTLEDCKVVDGVIQTREKYTHQAADCADAGRVLIRCKEDDRLQYSWLGWERVNSVLQRVGKRPPRPEAAPSSEGPSEPPPPTPQQASEEPAKEPAKAEPAREQPTSEGPKINIRCLPQCAAAPTGDTPWWLVLALLPLCRLTKLAR